jgi:hypothetical protein
MQRPVHKFLKSRNYLTRSWVGAIFFRKDTMLWPALPNRGNNLVFYRLPATTFDVAKTNTIICLIGGNNPLRFKAVEVCILSQKNTPIHELVGS